MGRRIKQNRPEQGSRTWNRQLLVTLQGRWSLRCLNPSCPAINFNPQAKFAAASALRPCPCLSPAKGSMRFGVSGVPKAFEQELKQIFAERANLNPRTPQKLPSTIARTPYEHAQACTQSLFLARPSRCLAQHIFGLMLQLTNPKSE